MAISLIDNLKIQNKKQNVERDSFATILDMVSYSPNYLPNIFHAMCEETGKMYVYNVNNDEDPDLGKWRVLEGSGGGTAEVPIEKIKVNGELQTPVNKVVDITVPDAYDDTALVQRISDIESDYAKLSDIPSLSGYATETWVNEQGFLTQHQDLSNYATKDEIPNLDGYAKTSEIPTKVSELENDSNYLSSIPEEYVTETELSAKGYLTEHQDISNLVEKEDGKGLSSNDYTTEEKNKLAGLENYNDTALSNRVKTVEDEVPNLATKTYVGEQIANAEHLKREIVTVLPSDEEASDNIIYMLKVESATGNDKYQEYMKIDGTLQMVGDTSVDLTDYAKTVDIPTTVAELTDSANYAKTSDVNDSISALQTDKANASDLTAHTDDADIHVTVENKTLWNTVDGKVDKTNILTNLDSSTTDEQVYSAKLVNDELDKKANNDEVLKKTDIVDNLTSTDTDKPLSANQGKILNDTKLNKTDANKLNCVTIDNVSLKEYILTNFTEIGKTYYLIAKTTCTDLPKASNFYITVETPGLYTYKVTAKELNDSNGKYVCTYRTISSSWTEWEKVLITGDIATTISDSSTDTQIPSAKAVNDILSTVTGITNARTYCLLSQLGITTPCTIKDIWDKMPSGSVAIVDADSSIVTDLDVIRIALGIGDDNEVYGILTVVKLNQRTTLEFRRARTNSVMIPDTFIGYCKGADCTSIRWKQIAFTTGVADVPTTTITPVNSNITGSIEYEVKNGICYVSMKDLMSTISSTNLLISNAMPKPSINYTASSVNAGGVIATIYIDKNTTNLRGNFYTKNAKSDCSFSYPVAES